MIFSNYDPRYFLRYFALAILLSVPLTFISPVHASVPGLVDTSDPNAEINNPETPAIIITSRAEIDIKTCQDNFSNITEDFDLVPFYQDQLDKASRSIVPGTLNLDDSSANLSISVLSKKQSRIRVSGIEPGLQVIYFDLDSIELDASSVSEALTSTFELRLTGNQERCVIANSDTAPNTVDTDKADTSVFVNVTDNDLIGTDPIFEGKKVITQVLNLRDHSFKVADNQIEGVLNLAKVSPGDSITAEYETCYKPKNYNKKAVILPADEFLISSPGNCSVSTVIFPIVATPNVSKVEDNKLPVTPIGEQQLESPKPTAAPLVEQNPGVPENNPDVATGIDNPQAVEANTVNNKPNTLIRSGGHSSRLVAYAFAFLVLSSIIISFGRKQRKAISKLHN